MAVGARWTAEEDEAVRKIRTQADFDAAVIGLRRSPGGVDRRMDDLRVPKPFAKRSTTPAAGSGVSTPRPAAENATASQGTRETGVVWNAVPKLSGHGGPAPKETRWNTFEGPAVVAASAIPGAGPAVRAPMLPSGQANPNALDNAEPFPEVPRTAKERREGLSARIVALRDAVVEMAKELPGGRARADMFRAAGALAEAAEGAGR